MDVRQVWLTFLWRAKDALTCAARSWFGAVCSRDTPSASEGFQVALSVLWPQSTLHLPVHRSYLPCPVTSSGGDFKLEVKLLSDLKILTSVCWLKFRALGVVTRWTRGTQNSPYAKGHNEVVGPTQSSGL